MLRLMCVGLGLALLLTILLVACGGAAPNARASNEVHMTSTDFVQKSVSLQKGQSITLIDDTAIAHVISNGTWENGTAKPAREPNAPEVTQVQISGNAQATIGPFPTAGTFRLYCTIHPGMNLTVLVQ